MRAPTGVLRNAYTGKWEVVCRLCTDNLSVTGLSLLAASVAWFRAYDFAVEHVQDTHMPRYVAVTVDPEMTHKATHSTLTRIVDRWETNTDATAARPVVQWGVAAPLVRSLNARAPLPLLPTGLLSSVPNDAEEFEHHRRSGLARRGELP